MEDVHWLGPRLGDIFFARFQVNHVDSSWPEPWKVI